MNEHDIKKVADHLPQEIKKYIISEHYSNTGKLGYQKKLKKHGKRKLIELLSVATKNRKKLSTGK